MQAEREKKKRERDRPESSRRRERDGKEEKNGGKGAKENIEEERYGLLRKGEEKQSKALK